MNKQRFVGIFWVCPDGGWIEIKRDIMAYTKEEAQQKALQKEDENPGFVKFVGWEGEVE